MGNRFLTAAVDQDLRLTAIHCPPGQPAYAGEAELGQHLLDVWPPPVVVAAGAAISRALRERVIQRCITVQDYADGSRWMFKRWFVPRQNGRLVLVRQAVGMLPAPGAQRLTPGDLPRPLQAALPFPAQDMDAGLEV